MAEIYLTDEELEAVMRLLDAAIAADLRYRTHHGGIASSLPREEILPEGKQAATRRALRDRLAKERPA